MKDMVEQIEGEEHADKDDEEVKEVISGGSSRRENNDLPLQGRFHLRADVVLKWLQRNATEQQIHHSFT